jgi:hypothetical protein
MIEVVESDLVFPTLTVGYAPILHCNRVVRFDLNRLVVVPYRPFVISCKSVRVAAVAQRLVEVRLNFQRFVKVFYGSLVVALLAVDRASSIETRRGTRFFSESLIKVTKCTFVFFAIALSPPTLIKGEKRGLKYHNLIEILDLPLVIPL